MTDRFIFLLHYIRNMFAKVKATVNSLRRGHASRRQASPSDSDSTNTNIKSIDPSKLLTEQRPEFNEEDVTTVWLNRHTNNIEEKVLMGSTRSINDYIQVRDIFK